MIRNHENPILEPATYPVRLEDSATCRAAVTKSYVLQLPLRPTNLRALKYGENFNLIVKLMKH